MKWANKKQNNFNIYNAAFFKKKIKKNTWRYHYQNLDDIIYSSSDIEQNIVKLKNEMKFFCPFTPLQTPKIKILINEKICWRCHILHICTKNHNQMVYGSWDTKWDRQNFLSFWAIFYPFNHCPLPSLMKKLTKV